jgi:tetraacyldisaccharide 4'-kinase
MMRILSRLFGAGVHLRNAAYDRGLLRTARVPLPVLSVGNISVGGTGKTPLTDWLVCHLRDLGRRPAVITRGYGRDTRGLVVVSAGEGPLVDARTGGDEPLQLARRNPWLIVVADEQRARGAAFAADRLGADVAVLDDGFQHRACARDLDIVALDASAGLTGQDLLPAGRLREPPAHLRRAHAVVLTRCDDATRCACFAREVARHTNALIAACRFVPRTIHRVGEDTVFPADHLAGRHAVTFCGIGNPASFRPTLQRMGVEADALIEFADHFPYAPRDAARIAALARGHGTTLLVTTEKDAMRLAPVLRELAACEVYYPELEVEFIAGRAELEELVRKTLGEG